jgi:hypothetical protein
MSPSTVKRTALLIAVACTALAAHAGSVPLGTADSFAVLAATTVTNTGPSVITGNVGLSPGTSVTGFPPGTVTTGAIHAADAVALQAQADANAAYLALAALTPTLNLTGQNLGGLTLTPGVYHFNSSAQLTGTLTLDGQGQSDPFFAFQIGSTLTTASASSILQINGAEACHIFFQVGSSATLGTGTHFAGNLLSLVSDTLNTGATVDGRVIALTGAVTLDTNTISLPICSIQPPIVTAIPLPSAAGTGIVMLLTLAAASRLRRPVLARSS